MRVLLGLTFRSLLWRRWASLGLLASAVVAFATAAVGPLWANAAEDSLLNRAVLQAPVEDLSVTVATTGNDVPPGDQIPFLAYGAVEEALRMAPELDAAFGPAQLELTTLTRLSVQRPKHGEVLAGLAWRPDGCRRLRLVAGRCPSADTELTMSRRTAAVLDVKVGQRVRMPVLAQEPVTAGSGVPFPTVFRVVGLYSVPPSGADYWAGSDLFGFSPPGVSLRDPLPARGDAMFGTESLLTRLAATAVRAEGRRVLDLSGPRADQIDPVEDALAAWDATLRSAHGRTTLVDGALTTLQGVHGERDAVRLGSYLLGLQLLVLVWYVLFLMTSAAGDTRSNDLALAKLRGLKTRTVSLAGALEPLVLVVVAAPVGLLLGLLVTGAAVHTYLPGQVALRLDSRLALAVLVALAGSFLAAGLGLRRTVRQPVLAQLQRASPTVAVRRLVVAEIVVVTAAVAALWQVHTRSDDDAFSGLALLAPGLGAVAVAVLAGRVLQQLTRPWARRTRHRADVAGFLASRQIGRRSGGTRTAIIATVAVSLSTFAVCTWGVVERQRQAQASLEVGATTVYHVDARSTPALLAAVQRIDPHGTSLLAAVEYPSINASTNLLAVDARRLATVADWPTEWGDVHQIARRLRPATASSIAFRGKTLTVDLDAAIVDSPDVILSGIVADRDGRQSAVPFAQLRSGPQSVTGKAPQCLGGCRLVSLSVLRMPGQIGLLIGNVTLSGLSVDGRPLVAPFAAGSWRAARINEDLSVSNPVATVHAAPTGLRMTFNDTPSESPGVVRNDVPRALPIVTTRATRLDTVGREDLVLAPGLDGLGAVQADVVGRTAVLPREGAAGVLADLEFAYRAAPDVGPGADFQIWANDRAPAASRLTARLKSAGVTVVSRQTHAESLAALGRTGPALALALLLGIAVAALSMAVLAVVAAALVQGRRRAYEVAALRTAGVPDRALRRAARREYGVQLCAGTVAGLLSGAGTALLVGTPIAHLGQVGTLAPASGDLGWTELVAVGLVSGVLFGLLSVACARAGLRFADPDVLRGAQT